LFVAVCVSALDSMPSHDTERRVKGHKTGRGRDGKFTP